MINRLTIFLLVLNVLIFGTLFFIDQGKSHSQIKDTKIFNQDEIQNIQGIEIDFVALGKKYILKKEADHWEISSPIKWKANPYAIQQVLSQMQFIEKEIALNVENIKSSGQSLSNYGFDTPFLTISLSTPYKNYEFKIAETKNVKNKYYLLTPEHNYIYIITHEFIENISSTIDSIKSDQVFNIPLFKVKSLVLERTNPYNLKVRLTKKDGEWSFEIPIQTEADKLKTDKLLSSIASIRVDKFIDYSKQDTPLYGLGSPSAKITIEGYDNKETLLIGEITTSSDNQTQYYAQLSKNPTLFLISTEALDPLKSIQNNLRQKSLLRFNADKLTSIKLSQEEQHLSLQKLEIGSWIIASHKPTTNNIQTKPADADAIEKIIEDLRTLEILNFVSDAPSTSDLNRFGLLNPKHSIEIKTSDAPAISLQIGNPTETNPSNIYVKLDNHSSIYEISGELLKKVPFDTLYYEDLTLMHLPSLSQIKSLAITNIQSNESIIDQQIDPVTSNSTNTPTPISNLINSLKNLKAETYLNTNYNNTYIEINKQSIYWQFAISFQIALPGDNINSIQSHTLLLTENSDNNTQYGLLVGHNFVFKVSKEFSSIVSDVLKENQI